MKRKGITLLCIVLSMIILQINVRFTNAQDKINLFDEILLQTKSKTVEYGLKTSFKTYEEPIKICSYLILALGLENKGMKLNITDNKESYCIEFSGKNVEGYIEALKYKNKSDITINISKTSNQNGLISLKDKVTASIGTRGKDIKYFQYLKAKSLENNTDLRAESIYDENEKILKVLRAHGTENIETVNLNNGLSTIAYTKQFDAKVTNNKLIDFNYAVCNYPSGRYIIIGTPEIITTY